MPNDVVSVERIGAIAQGIGSVLMEAMHFSDEGQPVTTTLLDYVIPTFLDIPEIELHHMESPSTTNPGGMKGAGEAGVVGAIPAVALALADALASFNPEINSIPLMPSKLLEIVQSARAGAYPIA